MHDEKRAIEAADLREGVVVGEGQPRHGGELHRMGDLVKRHPADKLVAIGIQAHRRLGEVGGDEQQPRVVARVKQAQLVLTEDALGEIAGQHADLGGQQHAGGEPRRSGERTEPIT